jgi:hypothetical protein
VKFGKRHCSKSFSEEAQAMKIPLTYFKVISLSVLFIAANSGSLAQKAFEEDYSDIVNEYRQMRPSILPANMDEYDELARAERELYIPTNSRLKNLHLKRVGYWQGEKRKCLTYYVKRSMFKNKTACESAMNANIQDESGRYIAALSEIGKIYEARLKRLNDAKRKFNYEQSKRTRQLRYRRVFKDSAVPQNRTRPD